MEIGKIEQLNTTEFAEALAGGGKKTTERTCSTCALSYRNNGTGDSCMETGCDASFSKWTPKTVSLDEPNELLDTPWEELDKSEELSDSDLEDIVQCDTCKHITDPYSPFCNGHRYTNDCPNFAPKEFLRDRWADPDGEYDETADMAWEPAPKKTYGDILRDKLGFNDGGSAKYYELPPGATELQDLIVYKKMDFTQGNIFKAAYRYGCKDSSPLRDLKKIRWFVDDAIDRLTQVELE